MKKFGSAKKQGDTERYMGSETLGLVTSEVFTKLKSGKIEDRHLLEEYAVRPVCSSTA